MGQAGGPRASQTGESEGALTAAAFGLGQLFEVVPDAVIIGDAASGRIALWNAAAAAIFGYEQADGPGLLIEDLVPTNMRAAHREGIARLARDEPTPLIDSESVVELPAVRKDGSSLWVELRLAHIGGPDGGRYALGVLRDVTIRREADDARDAVVRELEITRAELETRNRELDLVARTDHLTGIWNRRHVDEHLAAAISSARRHARPVSLLLLDVDEFKGVNERFGHQAGDRVLQEVVTRLKGCVRAEDTFGRWGGEEFLVVLSETSPDVALEVAERLRAAVAASPISIGGVESSVTVSIGVAGGDPPELERLIADADAALAQAKSAGKNRIARKY